MYIPCMLEPLPKGYEPPIQSAREAGTFVHLVSQEQATAGAA